MDNGAQNPGIVIAVGGLSGSGKSTLTRALQSVIGDNRDVVRINTDIVRKELWGIPPHEKLPDAAYHPDFSNKTFAEFNRRVIEAAKAGKVVLADCVFATEFGRTAFEAQVARESGARFLGLWVDVPVEILRQRVNGRVGDVSDADERILNLQLTFNLGTIDWKKIDGSGNEGAVLANALTYLRKEGVLGSSGMASRAKGFFFPERK